VGPCARNWDEGIVFGVARLEPRSNSASAGAKPGGIEAPANYPFILGILEVGMVFGDLKNSLLIPVEFLDAKKLRTLPDANQNSSLCSSDIDLLEGE